MESLSLIMNLFWIVFIFMTMTPMIRQRRLENQRLRMITSLEKRKGSRLITMIHRQESLAFLGIPLRGYINIEDSEHILRAIRMTPDDMPIDILLHTPGGLVLASEQIANAIKGHKAKVTVYVPHYAMSGGTLIALAADEIVVDENAVLGPVDPQIGEYPAVSILRVLEEKDKNEIDDKTLILADIARKALEQVESWVKQLLLDKLGEEGATDVAKLLTQGRWTHDYPITPDALKHMGLPVREGLPKEVYSLMELYPQTTVRRPSVQYIPVPYQRKDGSEDRRRSR